MSHATAPIPVLPFASSLLSCSEQSFGAAPMDTTATVEEVGWQMLRSAVFTSGESPRYSFYRRLSLPQGQSGHEGVKKILHSSDTRNQTRAVQPVAKRLAAFIF